MFGLSPRPAATLIGLAHVIVHPSTWTTGRYAYLEDLYVAPGGARDRRRRRR